MTIQIVIPIYKANFSELEYLSLQQVCRILPDYPITIVCPATLNTERYLQVYPQLTVQTFDDTFFHSLADYNRLLLSAEFYQRFRSSDYILIYQLDAYVFRDELADWCSRGYDYIGAPWIPKPKYSQPLYKLFLATMHHVRRLCHQTSRASLFYKVGNGGLSLRKVDSHLAAIDKYQDRIIRFLAHGGHDLYNEDVFWATEVPEFKYPTALEALGFAFDKQPDLCYKLNNNQLPFGCHAWYKPQMQAFWKPIIGF